MDKIEEIEDKLEEIEDWIMDIEEKYKSKIDFILDKIANMETKLIEKLEEKENTEENNTNIDKEDNTNMDKKDNTNMDKKDNGNIDKQNKDKDMYKMYVCVGCGTKKIKNNKEKWISKKLGEESGL